MSGWEQKLEQKVEEQRITLVDSQDAEYDFLILDEFCYNEQQYLALASCDEKTDNKFNGIVIPLFIVFRNTKIGIS